MITGVRSRGARLRSTAFGYTNLVPFVFFALFPFYFMLITSFKSNAELYSLKSVPLWIQNGAILEHYRVVDEVGPYVIMKRVTNPSAS